MLQERIAAFVRGESRESFGELALAAFAAQYQRSASYRERCDRQEATPATVSDWRRVPAVAAWELDGPRAPAPGRQSSELGRAAFRLSFDAACLEGLSRPPVLSLVPPPELAPDSTLAVEAADVLDRRAAPDSVTAVARRGIEVARARSFLAARQRDRRPTLVLAPVDALERLLAALDQRGLRFRLPPGSRACVAGDGDELGRLPDDDRALPARLAAGLGLPPEAIVRQYGPPALTSRHYAGYSATGEPRPFRPPTWTRTRVLDPGSRKQVAAGKTGLLAVVDLANAGSAVHLLTEDLALTAGNGFHLARAAAGEGTGAGPRAPAAARREAPG